MSNPLFNRFVGQGNPMSNAMQVANLFRQIQNDPSKITDLLLQKGRISEEQYKEMQKFGGNPRMMVQYLLGQGVMTQQDISTIQSSIPK